MICAISKIFLVLLCSASPLWAATEMLVVNEWKELKFAFPNLPLEIWRKITGAYKPENPFPLDADFSRFDPKGRVFVTTPRFLPGTPATLNTVGSDGVMQPYPDWGMNTYGNCNGITSVLRTKIDDCGRLWIVDSGVVDVLTPNIKRMCQPQVFIYNVTTDKQLLRYRIPTENLVAGSLLGNIAVDIVGSCENTYAYIGDMTGYGIIVLDIKEKKSWRVKNNYFYPEPSQGHMSISGDEFDLMDGLISLVLKPPSNDTLFFHSMASNVESSVPTDVLRDKSNFENGKSSYDKFNVALGQRSGPSGPAVISNSGVMFFSLLNDNSLNCWKSSKPYNADNIAQVFKNDEIFQFPSGLKLIRDINGTEWVWALTSRFQKVFNGALDRSEVNFRILREKVEILLQGTGCS